MPLCVNPGPAEPPEEQDGENEGCHVACGVEPARDDRTVHFQLGLAEMPEAQRGRDHGQHQAEQENEYIRESYQGQEFASRCRPSAVVLAVAIGRIAGATDVAGQGCPQKLVPYISTFAQAGLGFSRRFKLCSFIP